MSQRKEVSGDKRYYLQASLDYSRLFAQKHRVGAFAMVYQQETSDINFDESDLIGSIPHRNLAYSGRFTYAFKDRYMAEFNWDILVRKTLRVVNNLAFSLPYLPDGSFRKNRL